MAALDGLELSVTLQESIAEYESKLVHDKCSSNEGDG